MTEQRINIALSDFERMSERIAELEAQLAEHRKPMESMDTEQLSQWNVELSTLLCMPVSDRENLWWQIAVGDHLEKFAKSWHSSRIKELEVQVEDLKEIAEEERAVGNMYYNGIDFPDPSEDDLKEARDQLAKEHPEAFR